ncbi:MAG: tRNA dihydrouridine synthase DusB [Deltaproteobacteria bacterium]|nr:tRNA dihydrouridine synthase DusB [Deltaproteobacteria bacterium]
MLDNPVILAPLAGITNLPFRMIAKDAGCGLVCSEMISANGLVYKSIKTEKMLDSHPGEKPLSIQIFGSDPLIMAEGAKIVENQGADILDINFGCSVKKVVKTGAGVALMRTLEKAEKLLEAVRETVKIPMTIKIRTGWDKTGNQAIKISEIAQACGIDAIVVHPRTASQGFRGMADWSIISAVKKKVSIPVIGNGDIVNPEDAIRMLDETGCDAVMIGRAAIGNPSIFSRFDIMTKYLKDSVEYIGEKQACFMMRSRLGWFVKGMRFSSSFRESIKHISSEEQALQLIRSYRDKVMQR